MTIEEYYKAPPDEVFEDIKKNAISIWEGYEDPYKTEKINRVKDIQNIEDNAWFIVAMFDWNNKEKLLQMVQPKTAELIRDAISST